MHNNHNFDGYQKNENYTKVISNRQVTFFYRVAHYMGSLEVLKSP